ncbi:hypothetical protein BACCIP111895_02295 [Neobacillus rhizosphaerae]|uniref:Uncharacterized protein n=1 Tax=Neobacillus rhizosphaerae TaxID=2880965 RepID=A0ABM9ESG1_9BACI|nr:hypothetical protein [Neobacillus rhizosphaerae]CAH2715111.1 hypothetical protein BACCIP111895_02295 [Neobacillus rhizosphaerae]
MRYFIYIIQLVISTLGFLLFSIFSGVVGGYAIEYKKDPTIFDQITFAFNSSSYPLYACAFLLWAVIVIVIWKRKRSIKPIN